MESNSGRTTKMTSSAEGGIGSLEFNWIISTIPAGLPSITKVSYFIKPSSKYTDFSPLIWYNEFENNILTESKYLRNAPLK